MCEGWDVKGDGLRHNDGRTSISLVIMPRGVCRGSLILNVFRRSEKGGFVRSGSSSCIFN